MGVALFVGDAIVVGSPACELRRSGRWCTTHAVVVQEALLCLRVVKRKLAAALGVLGILLLAICGRLCARQKMNIPRLLSTRMVLIVGLVVPACGRTTLDRLCVVTR
jgi:hypothetical protein